jgi:hypothetical protein
MSFITTYTGGEFTPLTPRGEDVRIEDIAHALSMICRFTGHVARFYSVAEHCVNVSRLVPPQDALAGLLHDASEAYVADVSTPVKHSPQFTEYRVVEDRLLGVIFEKFGLPPEIPESVHRADKQTVLAEAAELFQTPPFWTEGHEPLPFPIVGHSPRVAERLYLERFKELTRC